MRTYPSACPNCRRELDAYTCVSDRSDKVLARAGDLTVCLYCATVCIFNHDQTLRAASALELAALDREEARALSDAQTVVSNAARAAKRGGV